MQQLEQQLKAAQLERVHEQAWRKISHFSCLDSTVQCIYICMLDGCIGPDCFSLEQHQPRSCAPQERLECSACRKVKAQSLSCPDAA